MMGRPSKLTPKVQQKLVDAIKSGNYYDAACSYAGIDYSTFRRWMEKGEQQRKGKFRDFCEAIKKAEAEAEIRIVALWQKQIPENWQAARDFLERRYPERWGRKDKVQAELQHSGQVTTKHEQQYHVIQQLVNQDDAVAERLLAAFRGQRNQESGS